MGCQLVCRAPLDPRNRDLELLFRPTFADRHLYGDIIYIYLNSYVATAHYNRIRLTLVLCLHLRAVVH